MLNKNINIGSKTGEIKLSSLKVIPKYGIVSASKFFATTKAIKTKNEIKNAIKFFFFDQQKSCLYFLKNATTKYIKIKQVKESIPAFEKT